MKTAILTCTYNNADLTLNCFKTLNKTIDEDTTLFWLDNGSKKSEYEKVKKYMDKWFKHDWIHVKSDLNHGFINGNNFMWRAVAEMDFDNIVLLNNDTELPVGWLERMRKANEKVGLVAPVCTGTELSFVGVKVMNERLSEFNIDNTDLSYDKIDKDIQKTYDSVVRDVKMIPFYCTMISRKVWESIGFLSTDYGIGLGDDDDYCHRARKAGFRPAVMLNLCIFHNHRSTFKLREKEEGLNYEEIQKKNMKIYKDKFNVK